MTTMQTDSTLDARGRSITTFVAYQAHLLLEELGGGQTLEVLTDEFEPFPAELAAWCEATGHRLIESATSGRGMRFVIEKGEARKRGKMLAMVLSTDGLEELLSPLGFALAAALEGIAVHLFLQGPAVRILVRGFQPRLRGWARPFTRFAAAGMSKAGHLCAQDKLTQLRRLGARLYACGPSMEHFRVRKDRFIFDDVALVEYLAFTRVLEQADIQLYS